MATRRQQFQVTHAGAVLAVAFNRDGIRLATGSDDKTARVWYTTTGNQQFQVTHARAVQAVAFSPDGTRLATGSMDTIARISDITGG
jgi:WD40 repeat protein